VDPAGGWLVHAGTAMVGSRSMLDDGLQIAVNGTRAGTGGRPGRADGGRPGAGRTVRGPCWPLYLGPEDQNCSWWRLMLVPAVAGRPEAPRRHCRATPEIARAAA